MKKSMLVVLIFALCMSVAFAGDGSYSKGKCKMSMDQKILKKMHFMLENSEELGLSEKQIEQIKKIKVDTKKQIIRSNAENDILDIDLKSQMYKDTLDVAAINALLDKKYEIKKEKAKGLVSVCNSVRTVLSQKQREQVKKMTKDVYRKKKRG